jgi:hypothetical protein
VLFGRWWKKLSNEGDGHGIDGLVSVTFVEQIIPQPAPDCKKVRSVIGKAHLGPFSREGSLDQVPLFFFRQVL